MVAWLENGPTVSRIDAPGVALDRVDDVHFVPRFQEVTGEVTPNETGSASDENLTHV
jgi:hypothetical protein